MVSPTSQGSHEPASLCTSNSLVSRLKPARRPTRPDEVEDLMAKASLAARRFTMRRAQAQLPADIRCAGTSDKSRRRQISQSHVSPWTYTKCVKFHQSLQTIKPRYRHLCSGKCVFLCHLAGGIKAALVG